MCDHSNTKILSDIKVLLARSLMYQLFAFLFRHPQNSPASFVQEMIPDWQRALAVFQSFGKTGLGENFEALIKTLQEISAEERTLLHEEYFGHTACSLIPAYELEYGEEHTHRQPQQLSDIAAFYNAFGLKINSKVGERVDHISVECEFMHYLLFKEANAISEAEMEHALLCREAFRHFFSEHLGFWGPSFCLRLAKLARQGLMRQTADFVLSFLIHEGGKLEVPLGPFDLPVRILQENLDAGCVQCNSASGCAQQKNE